MFNLSQSVSVCKIILRILLNERLRLRQRLNSIGSVLLRLKSPSVSETEDFTSSSQHLGLPAAPTSTELALCIDSRQSTRSECNHSPVNDLESLCSTPPPPLPLPTHAVQRPSSCEGALFVGDADANEERGLVGSPVASHAAHRTSSLSGSPLGRSGASGATAEVDVSRCLGYRGFHWSFADLRLLLGTDLPSSAPANTPLSLTLRLSPSRLVLVLMKLIDNDNTNH